MEVDLDRRFCLVLFEEHITGRRRLECNVMNDESIRSHARVVLFCNPFIWTCCYAYKH
jgi:hypothetical protein